ncbi:MAG TPA: bifunctional alpha,alpha-trehalose-phosphate synthase (UDP-forming)/trehalose-phosphatase [Candidatus Saccharimonadales bacterium]
MSKHQLVIVSNRLPVSVRREAGKLVFEPSSGGLATAMTSIGDSKNRVWVGWPGIASDDLTSEEKDQIVEELKVHGCAPVFLTKSQVEQYYDGYANDVLWPLFHYFQDTSSYKDEYWRVYQEVQLEFARVTSEHAEQESTIWVHDYHLMLLPHLLRQSYPNASIGFFLHIPFPSFEIFRSLPQRKTLLAGLLGADLIGFHIYDYARHFASSCERLLGLEPHDEMMEYQGRMIKFDTFPIGIDYKKFYEATSHPAARQAERTMRHSNKGKKILISVDRLDYSKGIPQRLEGFQRFLEDYPEYHGKVCLQMVAVPSRTEVETYQALRDDVEKTVSRINGMYGTAEWTPISYRFKNLPFDEIVGLYMAGDVALVTPVRDGMNLVAKEYVATKHDGRGVLILSEMAGAIDELSEAIAVNPNDTTSISKAILQALTMTKREQKDRLQIMHRRLSSYTVKAWTKDFMKELDAAGRYSRQYRRQMDDGEIAELLEEYDKASRRLLIFDYDGTLRDYVSSPRAFMAMPSLRLRRMIKRLVANSHNQVAVVSGRSRQALSAWFFDKRITLVAEHGAWIRKDGKWEHRANDFHKVKKELTPILKQYTARTSGSAIEEKDSSTVWHYRNVVPELAYNRAKELTRDILSILKTDSIGVFTGNKILEVRPKSIDKGKAVTELVEKHKPDFILCAGDDYTDEDMFGTLKENDNAHTIKVGSGDTKAKHQLGGVARMLHLLSEISAR